MAKYGADNIERLVKETMTTISPEYKKVRADIKALIEKREQMEEELYKDAYQRVLDRLEAGEEVEYPYSLDREEEERFRGKLCREDSTNERRKDHIKYLKEMLATYEEE